MMLENNYLSIINCYIVDSFVGNCGYFFLGVDGIVLVCGCVQFNDYIWVYEVGYYLFLFYLFSGWEGVEDYDYDMFVLNVWGGDVVEKLDGSNCVFVGDGFCDIVFDYFNYCWSCNSSFILNVQQIDLNGEIFVFDGSLFMFYFNFLCKSIFLLDQIVVMCVNVEEVCFYFLFDFLVLEDIVVVDVDEVNVVYFISDDFVEMSIIIIEWELVLNVMYYIFQINFFNIFSIIFEEMIVEGSSVIVSDLWFDEIYYWWVCLFNLYEICMDFIGFNSFFMGNVVSINQLCEDEFIEVYFNLVVFGVLNLNMKVQNIQEVSWCLVDGVGVVLQ